MGENLAGFASMCDTGTFWGVRFNVRVSTLGILRFVLQLTLFGFRLAPLLLVVYWLCIFTGTHLPGIPGPKPLFSDKVMHFLAFTGLAFIAGWAMPGNKDRGGKRLGVVVIGLVAYAAFDELTQSLVPRRSTELADFIADCLGIAVGLTLYLVARRIVRFFVEKQIEKEKHLEKHAVMETELHMSPEGEETVKVV